MTKKRSAGRPRTGKRSVQVGYRYSEESLEILKVLTQGLRQEAPPYVSISERAVIEALIHRAKRERDEGDLSWARLFGAEAANAASD